AQVKRAVGNANVNASGGFLERPNEEYLIRARGRVYSIEDRENAVVTVRDGAPAKLQTTVYPWHVYLLKTHKPEIFASEPLPISMLSEGGRCARAPGARESGALVRRSSVSRFS